jgi:hypothetical protein
MIDILENIKVEHIWSNDLFSQKSIALKLGIWDRFSDAEKLHYESVTPYDAILNGKEFEGDFKEEAVYGEITKNGVFELNNHIKSNIGVFYDIGSGNGKLLLQMAIISDFDSYVGVEIEKIRYLYSIDIKNQIGIENVRFINDDILNVDISDAGFIFLSDVMFKEDMRNKILHMIPSGCIFVAFHDFENCDLLDNIELEVEWMTTKVPFKIWKKQ